MTALSIYCYCNSPCIKKNISALDIYSPPYIYRAKGKNRPFLVLEPYTPRTRYLPRNSKYRDDSAVANANGVLVRLICDSWGPG